MKKISLSALILSIILSSCSTVSKDIVYEANDLRYRAIDNKKMAETFFHRKEYEKSIEYYKGALRNYVLSDNKSGIVSTLGDLGNIYSSLKDNETAMEYFSRALYISANEKLPDEENAYIYSLIGDYYYSNRDLKNADDYYKRAIEYYRNFPENEAGVKISRAKILNAEGDYQGAVKYTEAPIAVLEELYKKKRLLRIENLSGAYYTIGFIHFQNRKYNESEEFIRKALFIDRLSENSFAVASDYYSLGRIYDIREVNSITALYYYERSQEIYKYLNSVDDFIRVSHKIAEFHERSGDLRTALVNYIYIFNTAGNVSIKREAAVKSEQILISGLRSEYFTAKEAEDIRKQFIF